MLTADTNPFELIEMFINEFRFALIIFFIVGIYTGVRRFFRNRKVSNKSNELLSLFTENPNEIKTIAATLKFSCGSFDFDAENVNAQKMFLTLPNTLLGKHKILGILHLSEQEYFVATICNDKDFGMNFNGQMSDVKKNYQFNYKFEVNNNTNKVEVYSDIYTETTDKILRMEFVRLLKDYIITLPNNNAK